MTIKKLRHIAIVALALSGLACQERNSVESRNSEMQVVKYNLIKLEGLPPENIINHELIGSDIINFLDKKSQSQLKLIIDYFPDISTNNGEYVFFSLDGSNANSNIFAALYLDKYGVFQFAHANCQPNRFGDECDNEISIHTNAAKKNDEINNLIKLWLSETYKKAYVVTTGGKVSIGDYPIKNQEKLTTNEDSSRSNMPNDTQNRELPKREISCKIGDPAYTPEAKLIFTYDENSQELTLVASGGIDHAFNMYFGSIREVIGKPANNQTDHPNLIYVIHSGEWGWRFTLDRRKGTIQINHGKFFFNKKGKCELVNKF